MRCPTHTLLQRVSSFQTQILGRIFWVHSYYLALEHVPVCYTLVSYIDKFLCFFQLSVTPCSGAVWVLSQTWDHSHEAEWWSSSTPASSLNLFLPKKLKLFQCGSLLTAKVKLAVKFRSLQQDLEDDKFSGTDCQEHPERSFR